MTLLERIEMLERINKSLTEAVDALERRMDAWQEDVFGKPKVEVGEDKDDEDDEDDEESEDEDDEPYVIRGAAPDDEEWMYYTGKPARAKDKIGENVTTIDNWSYDVRAARRLVMNEVDGIMRSIRLPKGWRRSDLQSVSVNSISKKKV